MDSLEEEVIAQFLAHLESGDVPDPDVFLTRFPALTPAARAELKASLRSLSSVWSRPTQAARMERNWQQMQERMGWAATGAATAAIAERREGVAPGTAAASIPVPLVPAPAPASVVALAGPGVSWGAPREEGGAESGALWPLPPTPQPTGPAPPAESAHLLMDASPTAERALMAFLEFGLPTVAVAAGLWMLGLRETRVVPLLRKFLVQTLPRPRVRPGQLVVGRHRQVYLVDQQLRLRYLASPEVVSACAYDAYFCRARRVWRLPVESLGRFRRGPELKHITEVLELGLYRGCQRRKLRNSDIPIRQ